MKIDFVHTGGPYGDACISYEVKFPEGTTVREFVDFITDEYSAKSPDTWGFIELYDCPGAPERASRCLAYDSGSIIYKMKYLNDFLDCKLTRVTAHGGWSRMDYSLTADWEVKDGQL